MTQRNRPWQTAAHAALIATGVLLLCGIDRAASAEEAGSAPGTHALSIAVGSLQRRYVVHVPPGHDRDRPWPVVIMFHGGGGTARGAMWETGLAEKADREGFLAVFPEGTSPDPSRPGRFVGNPQTWNDGSTRGIGAAERKVADVEFVAALIADLKARFRADARRIYATGFSNGASMAFRIARELSRAIAAVAPIAGADWLDGKRPERAVPLLYITGAADPLNPVDGGEIRLGAKSYGIKPPVRDTIAKWVELNGCRQQPRVVQGSDGAKRVAWDGCGRAGEAVVLYTIDGHGHYWPGGKGVLPEWIAGKYTATIEATDIVWDFFKARSLPD